MAPIPLIYTDNSVLRRSHSARHKTCWSTGPATDQVRTGNQSKDREGARPRNPANAARQRGRDNRI